MPICRWLSKMIQSVAENDIIRADRVRIRSVLYRIRTRVYRIVYGCKQRAKSVNNLYTGVCIEMSIGIYTRNVTVNSYGWRRINRECWYVTQMDRCIQHLPNQLNEILQMAIFPNRIKDQNHPWLRFQDETHYVYVNLNNRTFQLTEHGINHLRELDAFLE